MMNISLKTKWIFLSFLQKWFKDHEKWTWNPDPSKTKIIIADKFSTEIGVAAKRPSIILDRGPIGWTGYFRNEAFPISKTLISNTNSARNAYSLTDLMQGAITLNVMAQTPYEADELANLVFYILSGYREWFKDKGISKLFGLTMGQESIVSINAGGPQVTLVQVRFSFQKQETVSLYKKQYSADVFLNGRLLQEGVDYEISIDGSGIKLLFATKAGDILTASFVDALTLDEITGVSLIADPDNLFNFGLPEPYKFYGFYKISAGIFPAIVEVE